MYLWCRQCEHAYHETQWTHEGKFPHGVCPICAARAYTDSLEWEKVAQANDYPKVPDPATKYPLYPSLF